MVQSGNRLSDARAVARIGFVQLAMCFFAFLSTAAMILRASSSVTMVASFNDFRLRYSPTLRFIVLGAMMYTLASVQGSIEALRSVNTITHFTHFTVAHAHLGLYGFFAMVMFGSTDGASEECLATTTGPQPDESRFLFLDNSGRRSERRCYGLAPRIVGIILLGDCLDPPAGRRD